MPIYDGVVTIDEADVQVILGVDEERIRLSAGGTEIGDWPVDECSIHEAGDGVFTITAEEETLRFTPASPSAFAAAMDGGRVPAPEPEPEQETEEMVFEEPAPSRDDDIPGAKPVTIAVFYILAAVTGLLGLWALVTLIL